jgi:hypothetical protein
MFCHKCGNKVSSQAVFCEKCGTKLHIEEPNAEPKQEDSSDENEVIELTVKNKPLWFVKLQCNVFIDNNKVGTLPGDGLLTCKIKPGKHCVMLMLATDLREKPSPVCFIWVDVVVGTAPILLTSQYSREDEAWQLVCNQSDLVIEAPPDSPPELGGRPYCPSCKSQDLFPISESEVNVSGGGYGFGRGCCGWILLGPIGLLLGFCGRKVKSETKTRQFWYCKSCGYKFRDPYDEANEKWQEKVFAMGVIAYGSCLLLFAPAILDWLGIDFLWIPHQTWTYIGAFGIFASPFGVIYVQSKKPKR